MMSTARSGSTWFLIPILLICAAATLPAQDGLHIRNDAYVTRIERQGSVALFIIEGYTPVKGDAQRIPARIIEIPVRSAADVPRFEVVRAEVDSAVQATPYYVAVMHRTSDSSFTTSYEPVPSGAGAELAGMRVLSERLVRRADQLVLQLEIPLLLFDHASGVRWVRSFDVRPMAAATARSLRPESDVPSTYLAMPFIQRAMGMLDTAGTWIDHQIEYRKFSIRQDGLHKIDKQWLAAAGFDTVAIAIDDVQLLLRGVPVPLCARGFDDGVFGANDGFVFSALRNYDPVDYHVNPANIDEPCPQYLNKYADSTTYWIAVRAGRGPRTAAFNMPAAVVNDTLDWAYQRVHNESESFLLSTSSRVERIQWSDWTLDDTWISQWHKVGAGNYGVNTPFLKPGLPARAFLRASTWYEASSINPFRVSMAVNDSPTLDTLSFPLNTDFILRATVPAANLLPDKNTIVLTNHTDWVENKQLVWDWYEMEYPHQLQAVSNQLSFAIDSSMAPGVRPIRVGGFTSAEIYALRFTADGVTHLKPLVRSVGAAYEALISDTVRPGVRYVFGADGSEFTPKWPVRVRVPDLRAANQSADYLILTAPEFLDAAGRYASMIETQYGVRVRVTNVNDIYDNYSYGFFHPEALKVYAYDAFTRWAAPTLKYLLLAGDANYNLKATNALYIQNYVPTYGFPAGDAWFVAFDSLSIHPQILLGRLPVRSSAEFDAYRLKHEKYRSSRLDEWNKTFMLFSSGNPGDGEATLLSFRNVNQNIINSIIEPKPLAGKAVHFFKTITPPADLGPYSQEFIAKVMDEGALLISYIGHSGTQTWDNAISEPSQLANKRGRSPVISDFGCSTAKFAEPDVVPFAELFVTNVGGQAMAYIGNSSLGFQTTSRILPPMYYGSILRDGVRVLGGAHLNMKERLLNDFGNNMVNRVTVRSNTLIGDPITTLPIPTAINLVMRPEWIHPRAELPTDADDSLGFDLAIANFGLLTTDSLVMQASVRDPAGATQTFRRTVAVPRLYDTLAFSIPVKNKSGQHTITITLDPDNVISELYEDDNAASSTIHVLSTSIKVVDQRYARVAGNPARLVALNPLSDPGGVNRLMFEFASDKNFTAPLTRSAPYGKTASILDSVPVSAPGILTYWRLKYDQPAAEYIGPYSYVNGAGNYPQVIADSSAFAQVKGDGVIITDQGLQLRRPERHITVFSAGFLDGSFGIVQVDGSNALENTYFRSYAVVLIDSVTVQIRSARIFDLYGDPTAPDSLTAYITSAPPGTLFAVSTSDEPSAQNGKVAPILKSLGSRYIGTLGYRSSWAMIGWRGAATGTVPEAYKPTTTGRVFIDTTFSIPADTGVVTCERIGPSSRWERMDVRSTAPGPWSLSAIITGHGNGVPDTSIIIPDARAGVDLTSISARRYPTLDVTLSMFTATDADSTAIHSIAFKYVDRPELAVNYQSVAIDRSIVDEGDSVTVLAEVLNAGEASSETFTIGLDLIDPNNVRHPFDSVRVQNIGSRSWFAHQFSIDTKGLSGRYQAIVIVDRNGEIDEQFEDNNVYPTSFTIRQDTTRPSLDVVFDGQTVLDGDFVRPRPVVRMTLHDNSPIPVTQRENFRIAVNDSTVSMTTPNVRIVETAPNTILEYIPERDLDPGENIFAFNAVDGANNRAWAEDRLVRVRVSFEAGIDRVYNYPNPFKDQTDFSFRLVGSTPPDRVELKIYTVAGRRIRTLEVSPETLHIGYNMVRWDGRDDDGDQLANGVYFFKVIATSGSASLEHIGRVAVLR